MTFSATGEPVPEVVVEQVRPQVTYRLRQQVLRPGMPAEMSFFPGDSDSTAAHFAAYLDNRVIGVASIYDEPEKDGPGRWRLRGMAVDDDFRGLGAGMALLERVRDFIRRSGNGLIWCNARVSAQGFYDRAGFTPAGDVWDEPGIGPHIRMHASP